MSDIGGRGGWVGGWVGGRLTLALSCTRKEAGGPDMARSSTDKSRSFSLSVPRTCSMGWVATEDIIFVVVLLVGRREEEEEEGRRKADVEEAKRRRRRAPAALLRVVVMVVARCGCCE